MLEMVQLHDVNQSGSAGSWTAATAAIMATFKNNILNKASNPARPTAFSGKAGSLEMVHLHYESYYDATKNAAGQFQLIGQL